jgi:hypothetical protein
VGTGISTNGREPFNSLAAKCAGGLCLFHPKSGRVEQLDEMLSARFAGG